MQTALRSVRGENWGALKSRPYIRSIGPRSNMKKKRFWESRDSWYVDVTEETKKLSLIPH